MANTSDIKNGLIINHKSGLWKIVEFLHVKPGKGGAFVRTKMKNLRTGQIVDETLRAGQKIETGGLYTIMLDAHDDIDSLRTKSWSFRKIFSGFSTKPEQKI